MNGVTVYISALVVGDKLSGQIWMGNNSVGSLQLTRKTVPVETSSMTNAGTRERLKDVGAAPTSASADITDRRET